MEVFIKIWLILCAIVFWYKMDSLCGRAKRIEKYLQTKGMPMDEVQLHDQWTMAYEAHEAAQDQSV